MRKAKERERVNDKYQVKYDVVKQAYAEFQYQSLASGLRPDIYQCSAITSSFIDI